jgi:hypothetical protein
MQARSTHPGRDGPRKPSITVSPPVVRLASAAMPLTLDCGVWLRNRRFQWLASWPKSNSSGSFREHEAVAPNWAAPVLSFLRIETNWNSEANSRTRGPPYNIDSIVTSMIISFTPKNRERVSSNDASFVRVLATSASGRVNIDTSFVSPGNQFRSF